MKTFLILWLQQNHSQIAYQFFYYEFNRPQQKMKFLAIFQTGKRLHVSDV